MNDYGRKCLVHNRKVQTAKYAVHNDMIRKYETSSNQIAKPTDNLVDFMFHSPRF